MDVRHQIRAGLQSQGLPAPTLAWIQTSALSNRNPQQLPPLPALVATAKSRLLAADLTNPALLEAPAPALPAHLVVSGSSTGAAQTREVKLPHDVPVQVLDIDNLTKSKWEQVEELEAIARGEQTRGREMVRLPASSSTLNSGDGEDEVMMDDGASTVTSTTANSGRAARPSTAAAAAAATLAPRNSTHKLVLQDCRGQKIHGLELRRMDRIGVGTMHIGEKLMLRKGAVVARGVVLLEPDTCVVLGGKVEAWQKVWVEGRLARLKEAVGGGGGGGGGAT